MEPAASFAIQKSASSSACMSISVHASFRQALMSSRPMSWKWNCWQRLRIVAGTFCSSVVANMKMMYSGGSSMVFSRALKAELESMCTSSMM